MFISENADGCSIQRQELSIGGWEIEPDGAQDAKHVSMGEQSNIALDLKAAGDDALYAESDMVHGFTFEDAIAP